MGSALSTNGEAGREGMWDLSWDGFVGIAGLIACPHIGGVID